MAGLKTKKLKAIAKNTLYLFIGFIAPIAATFIWYFAKGAFSEYLVAAFLQNFGYLSSWRPSDVVEPFLSRNGPLLIRAGIVAAGILKRAAMEKRKPAVKRFLKLSFLLRRIKKAAIIGPIMKFSAFAICPSRRGIVVSRAKTTVDTF